jgi:hypothetical protein
MSIAIVFWAEIGKMSRLFPICLSASIACAWFLTNILNYRHIMILTFHAPTYELVYRPQ